MRFARVVGAFGVGIESESTAEKRFDGFVRIAAHACIYRYADSAESRARSPAYAAAYKRINAHGGQ